MNIADVVDFVAVRAQTDPNDLRRSSGFGEFRLSHSICATYLSKFQQAKSFDQFWDQRYGLYGLVEAIGNEIGSSEEILLSEFWGLSDLSATLYRKVQVSERPDRGDPAIDLTGFSGGGFEAFCNGADALVGIIKNRALLTERKVGVLRASQDLAHDSSELSDAGERREIAAACGIEQGGQDHDETKAYEQDD